MLSDRDEILGVEKTSITDDNNTSFTSSEDGTTGCNPFLEVLKSSMSSSLLSSGVDDVINEVPSIEVDESDGDEIYNLIVNEREPSQTQIPAVQSFRDVRASVLERDTDNVANYISIKKIFDRNLSNYYYSESNFKARKKYEKFFKRNRGKSSNDMENLDQSVHSKISLVKHCISASSYQGPPPVKSDGSAVEGIMKKRNTWTSSQTRISSTQRSSESSSGTQFKSNITFSNVYVREYERIAGDNPCVRGGVPLSIGWANIQHESIPLDDYENAKGPPRDKIEMIVPADIRRSMLRDEFKVSVSDLNASIKSVNICKKHRANTLASEHLEVFQEVVEVAKRKFKRMVGKAVSTRKQAEELWQASHDAAMAEYLEENEGASLQMRNDVDSGDELLGLDIGSIIVCDGEENESDKK